MKGGWSGGKQFIRIYQNQILVDHAEIMAKCILHSLFAGEHVQHVKVLKMYHLRDIPPNHLIQPTESLVFTNHSGVPALGAQGPC